MWDPGPGRQASARERVVILGAAPLLTKGPLQEPSTPRALSRFIDESVVVIRMNNLKNLGAPGLGSRTDILALTNTGGPGRRYAERAILDHPVLAGAREIWFGSAPDLIEAGLFLDPGRTPGADERKDWAPEIIVFQGWEGRDARYVPAAVTCGVREELIAMGASRRDPSLGIRVVANVLHDPRFEDHVVHVLGFGFKGWGGHDWRTERRLVLRHLEQGRIARAPGSPRGRLFPHRVAARVARWRSRLTDRSARERLRI